MMVLCDRSIGGEIWGREGPKLVGRQARSLYRHENTPLEAARVYNYRSLPWALGEAMIRAFEGCFHENLWTMAQQCDLRRRNHFVQLDPTRVWGHLHDL